MGYWWISCDISHQVCSSRSFDLSAVRPPLVLAMPRGSIYTRRACPLSASLGGYHQLGKARTRYTVVIHCRREPHPCFILLFWCWRTTSCRPLRSRPPSPLLGEQPLLQWETLGPIVRAAAMAHAQKIPPAVVVIGTELAAAAVNLAPSEDGYANRTVGCNQKQGVQVLSAALRLVAQADTSMWMLGAQQKVGEGELYAQWVRGCFGAGVPNTDGSIALETGQVEILHTGQEQGASEVIQDTPCLRGLEVRGLYCLVKESAAPISELLSKTGGAQFGREEVTVNIWSSNSWVVLHV